MRRIEARGVIETAHRALQDSGQVLRYAVATGKATSNAARDLKGALRQPNVKHFAAITEPKRFGELLRAIDHYAATPVVRAALKLAPMLLLRPGELRFGEWSEIDLDNALWTVPAVRMKRELRQKLHGAPHLVPLPKQAVAVLRELPGPASSLGVSHGLAKSQEQRARLTVSFNFLLGLASVTGFVRQLRAATSHHPIQLFYLSEKRAIFRT